MKVGPLQEILWFGSAVYHVGENVELTFGRPTPGTGEPRKRGEGVATFWTSNSSMVNCRRAIEVVELQADLHMPADW